MNYADADIDKRQFLSRIRNTKSSRKSQKKNEFFHEVVTEQPIPLVIRNHYLYCPQGRVSYIRLNMLSEFNSFVRYRQFCHPPTLGNNLCNLLSSDVR